MSAEVVKVVRPNPHGRAVMESADGTRREETDAEFGDYLASLLDAPPAPSPEALAKSFPPAEGFVITFAGKPLGPPISGEFVSYDPTAEEMAKGFLEPAAPKEVLQRTIGSGDRRTQCPKCDGPIEVGDDCVYVKGIAYCPMCAGSLGPDEVPPVLFRSKIEPTPEHPVAASASQFSGDVTYQRGGKADAFGGMVRATQAERLTPEQTRALVAHVRDPYVCTDSLHRQLADEVERLLCEVTRLKAER